MKVILKENVESLGKVGDMVKVSDGYARNYLIPKGLALEASTRNIKLLDHEKRTIEQRAVKLRKSAELMQEKLEGVTCTIARKEGDQGKLFGSVTSKDIQKALTEQGIDIDKKNISLSEPLKGIGEYQVTIKIHHGVTADITVVVASEA